MTATQARGVANWLGNTRWDRTARTLEALEQCQDSPAPTATPTPGAHGHANPSAHGHANPGAYGHANPGAYGHANPGAYGHADPGAHGYANPGAYATPTPAPTATPAPALALAPAPTATPTPAPTATPTPAPTATPTPAPTATPTPAPTATPAAPKAKPEISIVGGGAVTEGGDATFTLTANPAPKRNIPIFATVSQDGKFTSSDGQTSTTMGRSGSTTFTVSTLNDDRDEPDGSITVTLTDDMDMPARYTVSATQGVATVVVSDDDAPGSGTTVTFTEFYAPYQALIAKVETMRNDPFYSQSSAHTDLYDTVLLALGRTVAKKSLQPMPAWRARQLAVYPLTDIWDEIGPALTEIEAKGPPPLPTLTLGTSWPTSINLSETKYATEITLTDHFAHERGDKLTYTATLDNPIAMITQYNGVITLRQTIKGTATLTVTASDGASSVSATASVEASCNPGSRLSSDGTFCVSAQSTLTYSGTLPPHPSSKPTAGSVASITLKEGESGTLDVRMYVDLARNDNNCTFNGYLTIEPQTGGQTIPTGLSVDTVGNTSSPAAAPSSPGWTDTHCANANLVNNGDYRGVTITYNLPADSSPSTTLNGAKLVYHNLGRSGSGAGASVIDTHDLVLIDFRDSFSFATVTATSSGDAGAGVAASSGFAASDFTITEGTSGTQTITLSGDYLIGYLAPRMEDIRQKSNGRAGHFTRAHMMLEHGHAVYWQPSVCAFNKPQQTGVTQTATCKLTWDWEPDGTRVSNGEVVLVWHETDWGWASDDIQTTDVATIRMADPGTDRGTGVLGADTWLKPQGDQNTLAADHADNNLSVPITTISEGGRYDLELWHHNDPDVSRFAIEVRTATNDHGTAWSSWKRFSTEVGRYKLAIQERSEYDLYVTGGIAPCVDPVTMYSCFGGNADRWEQAARHQDGTPQYRTVLTIFSHDDNFVNHPERYYQFRVKHTTNTAAGAVYPVLKVVEDDAVVVTVSPDEKNERGQLEVTLAKQVFTDIEVTLWTDAPASSWYNRVVIFDAEAANVLDRYGSKIIHRGCDSGATNIKVWATINYGQHSGVKEVIGYFDGNDSHVYVKCG